MELIVINENKLKITLTENEMKEYGLDENEFHLSLAHTRSILNKILHNSPNITGFERTNDNEKLLLQLYPEKNGGCELYVTRLCLDDECDETEDISMPTEKSSQGNKKALPSSNNRISLICYGFYAIADVIDACRALKSRNVEYESTLYMSEEEKFYLFLYKTGAEDEKNSPSSVLSEFGELENAERSILLMMERGKKISQKNAIVELSLL